jgi:hypothetical protein
MLQNLTNKVKKRESEMVEPEYNGITAESESSTVEPVSIKVETVESREENCARQVEIGALQSRVRRRNWIVHDRGDCKYFAQRAKPMQS